MKKKNGPLNDNTFFFFNIMILEKRMPAFIADNNWRYGNDNWK